jgi:hypothetical protein
MTPCTHDTRVDAYHEALHNATMAAARVEIASRFDGSYAIAVQNARLAAQQADAHRHALEHGAPEPVLPVGAARGLAAPIAVRCVTSPAHAPAPAMPEAAKLPGSASGSASGASTGVPLRGTVRFGRSALVDELNEPRACAQTGVAGGLCAAAREARTSTYIDAIKIDLERNVRHAQNRYRAAALPEERRLRVARASNDAGNLDALYWP